MSTRNCLALFCLAILCLAALTPAGSLLLWAFVLPFCFAISLALVIASFAAVAEEPARAGFYAHLPARAPPVIS